MSEKTINKVAKATDTGTATVPVFTKQQILESRQFKDKKYVLMTYLDEKEKYTIAQVEKILKGVK